METTKNMPRDKRFYVTYPNDMHRHPKLRRLAPDVRWTFVEMNGEASIANNDGLFSEEDAEFMWPQEHLDALCNSHPTRPLVSRVSGGYQIREYAQHQMTAADRDEAHQAAVERGRSGGLARARALQERTKQNVATQAKAKATELKLATAAVPVEERVNLQSIRLCLRSTAGLTISMDEAKTLCEDILSRADPDDPTKYIRAIIAKDHERLKRQILGARPVPEVRAPETCPKHVGYPFPCKRCQEGT
jgi:hypothetical protein